jgi:aminopeptidase N
MPTARPSRYRAALLAAALSALALPARAAEQGDVRLGDDVVPTFEAVRLRLDPGAKEYSGTVAVDLLARRPTPAFRFHARGQQLLKVALRRDGNQVVGFTREGQEIALAREAGPGGIVTARPEEPLSPGPYHLEITFTQAFNTQSVGLYRTEKDGKSYAFTQFEAADARRAFPCWDEPGVKIPYQLTVEIPAGLAVVSNTPEEKTSVDGGVKTVVFQRTPPLPAYLLALAVGPLEFTPIPGLSVPGRVVTIAGEGRLAGPAVELVPPLLAALERWFDRPFPFAKLDLIAAPEFWPGGMENAGAIVFAENSLLLDPATATEAERLRLSRIAAHELAHQWFGDLVTMAWWDDLWLNESFADWMGDKITDQVYPRWKYSTSSLIDIERMLERDARPSSGAIRRPVVSVDSLLQNVGVAYEKGKAVLGMFETFLGPETFRRGVQGYLREHAWGSATAGDLWRALGRAAGRDVGAAMATFIEQPGFPLVRVELLPEGQGTEGGPGIALSQERFVNAGATAPPLSWQIPVGLKYGDGTNVRTTTVLLTHARETVTLPGVSEALKGRRLEKIAWVMPDLSGAGYYRWSLPKELLGKLASEAPARLDARERIAFLSNSKALLDAGELSGDTWFEVATPFAADPEPAVVAAFAGELERVRPALVPDELAASFAGYVRRTFRPVLERIGRAARPGEAPDVPALRSTLLRWLGDFGRDEEVLRYAETLARRCLTSPAELNPGLATVALDLAAIHGDHALFEEYRKRFESAKTPVERLRYLRALGHFRDPAVREEILRYALSGPLRPNEVLRLAGGLGDTEQGADRIFAWVREHYDEVVARLPPILLPGLPLIASGCSAARLEQGRQFFSAPGKSVPGTERQLASVADQVHDCLRLRERAAPAVAAYLARSEKAAVK